MSDDFEQWLHDRFAEMYEALNVDDEVRLQLLNEEYTLRRALDELPDDDSFARARFNLD